TWSDAGAGPWSAAMKFTLNAPSMATLVSPSTTLADPKPTYTWNAVVGSTWYELWVREDTGPGMNDWYQAAAVGCAAGTGTGAVTPNVALRAGTVTWWVQTWSDAGTGPWSAPTTFTLNAPGMATLVSPSSPLADAKPTYTWNAVVGSTWYELWV